MFKQTNDDGQAAGRQSIFALVRSRTAQKSLVAGLRTLYSVP